MERNWVFQEKGYDTFLDWGKVLLLGILLAMGVHGYANFSKTENEGAFELITNPMMILSTATEAVIDRTNQLFGGVIKVGNELTSSVEIIKESLQSIATLLRAFYSMVTAFIIRFQKILQGLLGSALGIFGNIKHLLQSLMETSSVVIYTAETGVNLSQSVMNGPPGQAMRKMADLINALG